jgi:hypothetical protein
LKAFQNIATVSSLWLGGKKFQILTTDEADKKIYFRAGKAGGCAVKTNLTILVGLFDIATNDKQTAGNCNQAVERIADSLLASNY